MSSHSNLDSMSVGNILKKSSSITNDLIPDAIIAVNKRLMITVSFGLYIDILLKNFIMLYINYI